ncbi:hypothetical protein L4G92_08810 [Neisseria sp. ZJ106]|uniref:Lipoprotein n=1 Tax=Neisseria lisongii TaxID=2912188 RepID=A0ABY7RHQ3_9NEIS|nr:hypothetical protein [Neisseria lisongii]MCF7522140.1 hypothetical protein [Neisseria lisongii]WCL70948.1 hypothetical protein PJU73_06180 [Neisseria lisongii]
MMSNESISKNEFTIIMVASILVFLCLCWLLSAFDTPQANIISFLTGLITSLLCPWMLQRIYNFLNSLTSEQKTKRFLSLVGIVFLPFVGAGFIFIFTKFSGFTKQPSNNPMAAYLFSNLGGIFYGCLVNFKNRQKSEQIKTSK